ncbi:unnamed protein product [Rotaria sp. Silwood2]|nr:unnamed protein product [Rotaria sp. Silwood2]CAF3903625.1 unnamed protein product [Rotaria sp. Silwood2]
MVTVNNDDNSENESVLVIDKITSLFDRYHGKTIKEKYVKKKLIFYARTSGFINNIYRKQAWDLLVHTSPEEYSTDKNQIESHQYYDQIIMESITGRHKSSPSTSKNVKEIS